MNHLKEFIREVPDYPKPGILFYDLTTLLKNPAHSTAWSTSSAATMRVRRWMSSLESKRAGLFWRRRWRIG